VTAMSSQGPTFPCLQDAAVGWQTIHLEAGTYEGFAALAQHWAHQLAGELEAVIHGPDQCQCAVRIAGASFWLAYDDWQSCISLEPQDPVSAALIPTLFEQVRRIATRA